MFVNTDIFRIMRIAGVSKLFSKISQEYKFIMVNAQCENVKFVLIQRLIQQSKF